MTKREFVEQATLAILRGGVCNDQAASEFAVRMAESAWNELEKRCPAEPEDGKH